MAGCRRAFTGQHGKRSSRDSGLAHVGSICSAAFAWHWEHCEAGCRTVYIDGSFVTSKSEPGDYDACWDIDGVNVEALDLVFLDFSGRRAAQKRKYFGEFFPPRCPKAQAEKCFWNSSRRTKRPGDQKELWG